MPHANQELQHAELLAERIQHLGGIPVFEPGGDCGRRHAGIEPAQGHTLIHMIREDLILECQPIERDTALASQGNSHF
jgi:bacterioferritin